MIAIGTEQAAKMVLRIEAVRVRDSIAPEIKRLKDKEIQDNLFETEEFIKAKMVMFFASIRSEPNTLDMIQSSLNIKKTIVLPRVNLNTRELEPYAVRNLSELVLGYMDIPEPRPQRRVCADDIDIIVMPGLAFDKTGGRIGYGGGYYDRFIGGRSDRHRPVLAAIAYGEQIFESVPVMSHDVRVDMIVTDSGVLYCRGGSAA
ncbi:5-formyltetrahydrofolate cyclo-ligase [Candidatus Magnetominusculus dajiuhuensis]|uniref:5-formyltetrahydrofolate cyclo-ligase n=1 Tax=Candidatus Magnetominusculus dajiuhuensis TaxID=3137712 RepID=UPI003B42F3CE